MVSGISSSSTFNAAALSEMWQKMFNKIDTKGDGSIDKTEMTTFLQQNNTQDISSFVDEVFSNLDTNQDDLISQIESNSVLAKLEHEKKGGGTHMAAMSGMPPAPEKVFDTADTNKDGVVSKDELAAVIGQSAEDIDEIFSKVDTDGDGLISRTEDETFREQMTTRIQQNESANSGTNDIGSFGQSWQRELFDVLLKGLTATAGSTGELTSVSA
ncbi:MAG: EF-hand domain-containing protein [Deltaproteobacteria bacterium]|nr:EF-hand domain-containing protein [Deltaproteobacteria bacterium]